jgi:hypothetical protein
LWNDLTAELVSEIVADAPWIDGIDDVCADIAERGERSMLITNTVAVNADVVLERAARVVYRGEDLREAHAQGRALLDDPVPSKDGAAW